MLVIKNCYTTLKKLQSVKIFKFNHELEKTATVHRIHHDTGHIDSKKNLFVVVVVVVIVVVGIINSTSNVKKKTTGEREQNTSF